MSADRVAVLGFGAWGTAISVHLARGGHAVRAWTLEKPVRDAVAARGENAKYLPGIAIPNSVEVTLEAREALEQAAYAVWALPTQSLREAIARVTASVPADATLVSLAKGLEQETHLRPTRILAETLPDRDVAAVLGPSHAEEVARGVPTSVAACAEVEATARRVQALFHAEAFRVYRNDDLVGAEYATALKNVFAVAAGISDGLGFGDNTKGALLSRGLAEMSRLGTALGGRRETFFGLTGVGDLVTTCFSRLSRNRHVGEQIGRGRRLPEVLAEMTQVAEGVPTSRAALELARERGLEVPIIEQVVAVLFENKPARAALLDLLARDPRKE